MPMTEEAKRAAYLEWINEETGQNYEDGVELPVLVELILDKLMAIDGDKVNIKSVSQGGRSVSFVDGIPKKITDLMKNLRKLRWD